MRKLFLATAIAFVGLSGLNAQSTNENVQTSATDKTGFEAGIYVGAPMSDAKDVSSFNLGVTLGYYWDVADNFKAGLITGYDHWFGKDYDYGPYGSTDLHHQYKFDMGFIPIAASAKYSFGDWFAGLDLGYAIYVGGDAVIGKNYTNAEDIKVTYNGGFYYRPRVGWSSSNFDVYGFYKGISMSKSTESFKIGEMNFEHEVGGGTISSIGVGVDYKF